VTYRATESRVLAADYDLIRKDFPVTRAMSEAEIDRWLIESAAFVSKDQVEVGLRRGTNTEILHDRMGFRAGIRPPNYGRALVFEVEGGLIDAKGAGGTAAAISTNSHRNGLMETSEALREFAYTKLVKKALHHSASEYRVIDGYAVIDYGFKVLSPVDATFQPAGVYLRQAHFRDITKPEQLERKASRKIERALREYGITSAYKQSPATVNGTKIYDILNVQGSEKDRYLFDFGGYRIREKFEHPGIVLRDLFSPDAKTVVQESHLSVLQPQAEFRGLFEKWGGPGEEERIWKQTRAIATEFQKTHDVSKARKSIQELLEPLSLIPETAREKASFSCMRQTVERMLLPKD
jgi:hypothetical protein